MEGKKTKKCPHCGAKIPDDRHAEMAHMDRCHPEIVAVRQAEAERLR